MTISNVTVLANGGSGTDATSYNTASQTPTAGRQYLLAVHNAFSGGTPNTPTVTGNSVTWTQVATNLYDSAGSQFRLTVFEADGVLVEPTAGALTIDFAGQTQGACDWICVEMDGADTTAPVVQSATGTGTSTTPLATLAAFASANNATFGFCAQENNSGATEGTGFTEIADVNNTSPTMNLQAQWRVDNDTSVDWTITSAIWGTIALEIKAAAAPASAPYYYNSILAQQGVE